MKNFIIISSITILLFNSCTTTNNKQELINNITANENNLMDSVNYTINNEIAEKLILQFKKYVEANSSDSLAPIYTIKAADLCLSTQNYEEAVKLYEAVYTNYPNYKKAPESLFLQAMIYADHLKNEVLGKQKYEEFIITHPNHQLVNDARKSIQFLGKTPEEILNIIQKNATKHN